MAEQDDSQNEDRTEEATPERREEFRDKGMVTVSREITSVLVLALAVAFVTYYAPKFMSSMKSLLVNHLQTATSTKITDANVMTLAIKSALEVVLIITPLFLVITLASTAATFFQTRFNFAWNRIAPDWSRMSIAQGLVRMVNFQALMELAKSVGKTAAVALVAYLILYSEWIKMPGLMIIPIVKTWQYWAQITQNLFFGVAMFLVAIAAFDYFYNFISMERKLKMTKKEVKEELKRRETDPHVKGRMRRMQREFSNRRMIEKTRTATVIVTNPTHYSVALLYELGMAAPQVVAKGKDFLAMQMREAAKEEDIPIVENAPLARTLFKLVEVGHEIPDSLYKAVSEIIRFVFKAKGINYKKQAS